MRGSVWKRNKSKVRQNRRMWFDYGIFWVGATVVGLCAVGYAHLIDSGYGVFQRTQTGHHWLSLIVTPLLGGLSVWLTRAKASP